jgi:folate-binding protein YgfZ
MVRLENMDGAIRFSGPDARTFLQGQLTADLRLLTPGNPLLAAYCTPQGRVISVLRVSEDAEGILARLPGSMVDATIAKLRKYVLRAKVTMTAAPGGGAESNESRLRDIAAGQPQVYPETSEAFVAQMLNLDLLGGISFNKGCYTGQEIVARAHFRGQVKRRMQRFHTTEARELKPGDEGELSDGRAFKVVQAAQLPDGRCEFLAVAPFPATDTPETLALPYELPTGGSEEEHRQ